MTRPIHRKPPSHLARAKRALRTMALVMSLGAPSMVSAQATAQHAQAVPVSDGAGERAVLERINELREQNGLPPLTRDARLDSAALTHSAEMSSLARLQHVSTTTGSPLDRAQAVGVTSQEIAENVARGPATSAAQGTLEASAPHLANILNPSFTHIGIASVAHTPGFYMTEVFARIEAPVTEPVAEPTPASVVGLPASTLDGAQFQPIVPTQTAPTFTAPPDAAIPAAPLPEGQPNQSLRVEENGAVAYWICSDGRWWFYPVPQGAAGGQQLTPDLTRTGSPTGYGACSRAPSQGAVQVGAATPQPQQQQVAQGPQPLGPSPAAAPGYGRPGPGQQQPQYRAPTVVQPGGYQQQQYPQQQYPQQQYPQQQYQQPYPQQQVPARAYRRGWR